MKVKELIQALEQCNPEFNVFIDDCSIESVDEKRSLTSPDESCVDIRS